MNFSSVCSICAELNNESGEDNVFVNDFGGRGSRIVRSTENLVLLPTIGPLTLGHMMIFSKEHHISFAHMPEVLFDELEQTTTELLADLESSVGASVVFEHGPMSDEATGGACTDHAHLHFVPLNDRDLKPIIDQRLTDLLGDSCRPRPFDKLAELREQARREVPYIMFQDQARNRWVYDVVGELPCQFLRRTVGEAVGVAGEWDWVGCPRKEVFNDTLGLFGAEPAFEVS